MKFAEAEIRTIKWHTELHVFFFIIEEVMTI